MTHARVLGGLVLDTVEALGCGVFVKPCERDCDIDHAHDYEARDVRAQLEAWWCRVHSEGEKLEDVRAGTLAPSATIRASGRGGAFPLCVMTPHWRVFVNPWSAKARIVVAASYLASVDIASVRTEVERIGEWLWGSSAVMKLSQLHIAADMVGLSIQRFARLDDVLTHAKRIDSFYDDSDDNDEEWGSPTVASVHASHRRVTGVTIGSASSRLQCCIYDKVEQLRTKRIRWGLDYLGERGWNGTDDVVRVEMRFRARALDEFMGLDLRALGMLDSFGEWGSKLWRYAARRGVRYVVPRETKTRSRWPMRDDWKHVLDAAKPGAARRSRTTVQAQKDEAIKRASSAFVTSAIRLAAEDPATTATAREMMQHAREHGEASSRGLIMTVLVRYGDALCTRALGGETSESEKHLELLSRLEARRRHVESRDAPPEAKRPSLAKVRARERPNAERYAS